MFADAVVEVAVLEAHQGLPEDFDLPPDKVYIHLFRSDGPCLYANAISLILRSRVMTKRNCSLKMLECEAHYIS